MSFINKDAPVPSSEPTTTVEGAEHAELQEGQIDFSKCQIDEMVKAYLAGEPVEWECLSPYIADHNMFTGDLLRNNLTAAEKIGIAIGKALKEMFPKGRMISLYDEYNTDMPDSEGFMGRPTKELVEDGKIKAAPQIEIPETVKNNFRQRIEELLRDENVIHPEDVEHDDYLFISESEKIADAEVLVGVLEQEGLIERNGKGIFFLDPKAGPDEDVKITLRTKNGRWMCEALDSSSYIKEENKGITHLVILPNHFKPQQEKVWRILNSLGIQPTNYHNIFFDEDASSDAISEAISDEIGRAFEKVTLSQAA